MIFKDKPKQKPVQRLVRCCQCGGLDVPEKMWLVGDGVYKCAFCLLGTKEGK